MLSLPFGFVVRSGGATQCARCAGPYSTIISTQIILFLNVDDWDSLEGTLTRLSLHSQPPLLLVSQMVLLEDDSRFTDRVGRIRVTHIPESVAFIHDLLAATFLKLFVLMWEAALELRICIL